jgi:hypothetical protein
MKNIPRAFAILSFALLSGCGGSDTTQTIAGTTAEPVNDKKATAGGNYLDTGVFPFDWVFEIVDRDEIPAITDRRMIGPSTRTPSICCLTIKCSEST